MASDKYVSAFCPATQVPLRQRRISPLVDGTQPTFIYHCSLSQLRAGGPMGAQAEKPDMRESGLGSSGTATSAAPRTSSAMRRGEQRTAFLDVASGALYSPFFTLYANTNASGGVT